MSKLSYRISYYVLYAIFAVAIVVLCFFFYGGETTDHVVTGLDPEMWQPAQMDILLYLLYGVFAFAVCAMIVAVVFQFIIPLKDNPKKAIKSFTGLLFLAAVLIIAWIMGDGTPMDIRGYDGADNVPFWLKVADMFLYTIYILLSVTVLVILVSGIKKRLS